MFLLFLFGLIFFTTLITHYFYSFDGISIGIAQIKLISSNHVTLWDGSNYKRAA